MINSIVNNQNTGNDDERNKLYNLMLEFKPQAKGWAQKQLSRFPARIKTGEDIFLEACIRLIDDMVSNKIEVQKEVRPIKNMIYNYMKRLIQQYKTEEWTITREYQYAEQSNFDKAVSDTTACYGCSHAINKNEKEERCQEILDELLDSLNEEQRKIVGVAISDENDLFRMLYPISGELTNDLIQEMLKKQYILPNGDTGSKFKNKIKPADLRLSRCYKKYFKAIHKILKANRVITSQEMIASYLGIPEEDVRKNCVQIRKLFMKIKAKYKLKHIVSG